MARAWITELHGKVYVAGEAWIDGKRVQRKRRVPRDDRELADESVRLLNARFVVGDLAWFETSRRRAARRPASDRRRPERHPSFVPTLEEWKERWLEAIEAPEIAEHTFRNYCGHVEDLCRRIGGLRLDEIDVGDVLRIRKQLRAEGRKEPTIRDRLGVLRMMIRDARLQGIVKASPFDTELPRRRTKRKIHEQRVQRVHFRPFVAKKIEKLLSVLRAPEDSTDRLWFPFTEWLLLTGLRWGEGAAFRWSDVSLASGRGHVRRALPRHGPPKLDEPTKTGAEWTITLRRPTIELLHRQRQQTPMGRADSWIFPNTKGGALSYHNWLHRGWPRVLRRAGVQPSEGNAQKALRRTYITSALVCGRNPKEIAGEVGHTSLRMILEQYDTFVDPQNWPDTQEIALLRSIYGWDAPSGALQGTFIGNSEGPNEETPPS